MNDFLNQDLISVIIPFYNAEKYISNCLQSVITQSYSNIEIICVNDCSIDSSCQKVLNLQKHDSRIKLVNLKTNSGVSQARNKGLEVAKGSYIIFCDADDLMKNNMLEIMYLELKEKNADIAICCYEMLYVTSNKIENYMFNFGKSFKLKNDACSLNEIKSFLFKIKPAPWTKLCKKEILINTKFEPTLSLGEDFLWSLEVILKANRIVFLDKQLYQYKIYDSSLSYNVNNIIGDLGKMFVYIKKLLIKNNLFDDLSIFFEEDFYNRCLYYLNLVPNNYKLLLIENIKKTCETLDFKLCKVNKSKIILAHIAYHLPFYKDYDKIKLKNKYKLLKLHNEFLSKISVK